MSTPSPQTLKRLARLEKTIEYSFKDKELAILALTHSSYGDGRRKFTNNERLEFMGDRVLGLLTAERLYMICEGDEGSMARRLNALVRKETCALVARSINLGEALLISPSEIKQGGRDKTSILGDACESLLAAIYIDGGYEVVKTFYSTFWGGEIRKVTAISAKDPKTELQERASAAGHEVPVYSVLERKGPDHRPMFLVEVDVKGLGASQGTGKSKKDAERFAAQHLLENWHKK
ncbi:MAG: ribonuclease III [Robiginitomaculum sp.]|nr:MAG: ribonuclease III [Robiginitomaculum sp.]